jgi:hypothetical protein
MSDKFEEFLATQSDEIKASYEEHVHGLKSALQSERDAHTRFEAQVKEVSSKLENTDATRQALEKASAETGAKVKFYDLAHKAGVSDLGLGFLAAQQEGLITDTGVDLGKLKELHPGLFGSKAVIPGNAGEHGTVKASTDAAINQSIRDAAKRN